MTRHSTPKLPNRAALVVAALAAMLAAVAVLGALVSGIALAVAESVTAAGS